MFNSMLQRRTFSTFRSQSVISKVAVSIAMAATLVVGSAFATQASAQSEKIGFVNTERLLRESAPAKAAQAKIESEFKPRDQALQNQAAALQAKAQQFDKDSPILSDSQRASRQRELSDMDADLQRKRREFQDDFNRERNAAFSSIVAKANAAIKAIAQKDNYDLILQDAVTVSPKVDITDQVIKVLNSGN